MKPNHYSKSVILSILFFPLGILYSFKVKYIGRMNLLISLLLPTILIVYIYIFFDIPPKEIMILIVGINGITSSMLLVDLIAWRNTEGEDVFEGLSDTVIVYLVSPLLFLFSLISFLVILLVGAGIFEKNGLSISIFHTTNVILSCTILSIWFFHFIVKMYIFTINKRGKE